MAAFPQIIKKNLYIKIFLQKCIKSCWLTTLCDSTISREHVQVHLLHLASEKAEPIYSYMGPQDPRSCILLTVMSPSPNIYKNLLLIAP